MSRYHLRYDPSTSDKSALPINGGITPAQVCRAYEFQNVIPVRDITMGIVSLGGYFNENDSNSAFDEYGLPRPHVTISGEEDKTDDLGAEENMLDIQCLGAAYSYSTGQPAKIIEQFEKGGVDGIARAIKALVDLDCEIISVSWGWPASEVSSIDRKQRIDACIYACNANCHVFAASGDESIDDTTDHPTPNDPCCDPNVWSVGGTTLKLDTKGNRISEAAWGDGKANAEGGGGGFDKDIAMPDYQRGVVTGNYRGCPDSSAHAYPAYTLYALGQWMLMGGTSASTPITAGYIAAILSSLPGRIESQKLKELLYKNRAKAFFDITTGSNGDPAAPGWDPATGCGSINGPGLLNTLTGK